MKSIILSLLLLCLCSVPLAAQEPAKPGHFDYYLLDLSWSPAFCDHLSSSPQCSAHPGFVLHGLWPQNVNGTWPANCDGHQPGPTNLSQWLGMTPDLSLLKHEWSKHGTCTQMTGNEYFMQESKAYQSIHIPPLFTTLHHKAEMKPSEIVNLFVASDPRLGADNLNVRCYDHRLTAIDVCLNKALNPTSCTALRKCEAEKVMVLPPSANKAQGLSH